MAFCAAALACSFIASMPASAAVPIEPGISVTASVKEHPAPLAILDIDHVAITALWPLRQARPVLKYSATGNRSPVEFNQR
jgi:hypothetical protein